MPVEQPTSEGVFLRLEFSSNLPPEILAQLLPLVAYRTGVQAQVHLNPVLHLGVTGMSNDTKNQNPNVSVGDVIGSAIGAVGEGNIVNQHLENVNNMPFAENIKAEFSNAYDALKNADLSADDKKDVAESLEKLAAEVARGEAKDLGRLKRFYLRIKEVAPAVATALSIVASTLKIASH